MCADDSGTLITRFRMTFSQSAGITSGGLALVRYKGTKAIFFVPRHGIENVIALSSDPLGHNHQLIL